MALRPLLLAASFVTAACSLSSEHVVTGSIVVNPNSRTIVELAGDSPYFEMTNAGAAPVTVGHSPGGEASDPDALDIGDVFYTSSARRLVVVNATDSQATLSDEVRGDEGAGVIVTQE